MAKTTITEALAELKTLEKRIAKKIEFVKQNIGRHAALTDPLLDSGGSQKVIEIERQAMGDLWQRGTNIRLAIAAANAATEITVCGETKSIAEWLIWRREVAPKHRDFLMGMNFGITSARTTAKNRDAKVVDDPNQAGRNDILIHISERGLALEQEKLEEILGTLDGLLSLKNATVTIDVQ